MFRSTTIIRELVLNLTKVIFMLKHSVKLRRSKLFGDMAACHRAACVLCAQHTTRTTQIVHLLVCELYIHLPAYKTCLFTLETPSGHI